MGPRIVEARERLGYTQAQLAERVPCNPQTVSNWETGRRQPRYDDLVRLAEILGRPVSWLLGESAGAGLDEVEATLQRVEAELANVRGLLRDRRPAPASDPLVPIRGSVDPSGELIDEPVGWRVLSTQQAEGVQVYLVRGHAWQPWLQSGDLIGIGPETNGAAPLLVHELDDGRRVLRESGSAAAPAGRIVGSVRWQQRDYGAVEDATVAAAERRAWLEQAEQRVDAIEQRIEQGDGQWSELRALCDEIGRTAELLQPVYGSNVLKPAARALSKSARSLGEQGRYPEAKDAAARAEEYYRRVERLGERSRDALNNLYNLSQLALFLGELELAEAAAMTAAQAEDWSVRWKALKNLAEIRVNFRAELDEVRLCDAMAEMADEHLEEDPVQAYLVHAVAAEIRGHAAFAAGDLTEARKWAGQELDAAEKAGLPYRIANALLNLAQYAAAAGDPGTARQASARMAALTAAQDLGDLEAMRKAMAAAVEDDDEAAMLLLHRALREASALGSPRASLYAELAGLTIARRRNLTETAADHAEAAGRLAEQMGLTTYRAVIERMMAEGTDGLG